MEKKFKLIGLDCADCGAKIERGIQKIKEVNEASVNFMSGKLIIDINDDSFEDTFKKVTKAVHKVDSDIEIKEV